MSVVIDSKMPIAQQEQARLVVTELRLDNLEVTLEKSLLVFTQDRRVVSVPVDLIEKKDWADIRFLFRAILESPNSLWNRSADDNDWGGLNFYDEEGRPSKTE